MNLVGIYPKMEVRVRPSADIGIPTVATQSLSHFESVGMPFMGQRSSFGGGRLQVIASTRSLVLYLVRHGESTWNVQGRIQGQLAFPELTWRGRRQVSRAADALVGQGAGMVVTSDLTRAVQTADIIAKRLCLRVRRTPLLRERNWGYLQGSRIGAAVPVEEWDDDTRRIPGGESRQDVLRRLSRFLMSAAYQSGSVPLVVVSHGDTIVEAIRAWSGTAAPAVPSNGSVTRIELSPNFLVERQFDATTCVPRG